MIAVVAGKSGGHILPALVIAEREREQHEELLVFTTNAALDRQLVMQKNNVQHVPLNISGSTVLLAKNLCVAWWHTLSVLREKRPSKIVSTGGLVSVPVCLAAWWLKIPIDLYELNVIPGKAVRFLAPFATRVCVVWKGVVVLGAGKKVVRVPYPLRFVPNDFLSKEEARVKLGYPRDAHIILVLGGSQGSLGLNKFFLRVIQTLDVSTRARIFIAHQTGNNESLALRAAYEEAGITSDLFAYRNDIATVLCAADCVVSRAGAGALAELIFFKKKALIVPLETAATDHQLDNARAAIAEHGDLLSLVRQPDLERDIHPLTQFIQL